MVDFRGISWVHSWEPKGQQCLSVHDGTTFHGECVSLSKNAQACKSQESCSNEYAWVQSKPTCVNPACFDLFRCARVSFAISRGNSERNLEPSNRPMVLLGQEIWAKKAGFHRHFAWDKLTLHYDLRPTDLNVILVEQICQCLSSRLSRSPTSTTSKSKTLGTQKHSQAFTVDILMQSTFPTLHVSHRIISMSSRVGCSKLFSRSRWWAKSLRNSLVLSLVIPILCAFGQNFGNFERQTIPSCRSVRRAFVEAINDYVSRAIYQPKIETGLRSWRLEIHEGWTQKMWWVIRCTKPDKITVYSIVYSEGWSRFGYIISVN